MDDVSTPRTESETDTTPTPDAPGGGHVGASDEPGTATSPGEQPSMIESELLVEEVSIDGMCGVY